MGRRLQISDELEKLKIFFLCNKKAHLGIITLFELLILVGIGHMYL